jgi:hypothetical protein
LGGIGRVTNRFITPRSCKRELRGEPLTPNGFFSAHLAHNFDQSSATYLRALYRVARVEQTASAKKQWAIFNS